ncbi:MAG: 1,6-anhydro-N-acetylmuramyl-L-alanine amidase AmpD [Pseudohongiellaceae bacterium]
MTEFTIQEHWLTPGRRLQSPNQSSRANEKQIELLVIHNISLPPGEFGGPCIDELFCNRLDPGQHEYFRSITNLRVSSHLLIDRKGVVTQYVAFNRKAWHAGESCYQGRGNCNEFSIGIELEGTDFEPFTGQQYLTLGRVTDVLLKTYPGLSRERIVGHSDIAPGRKTDPGPCFDWPRFRATLCGNPRAKV